MCIIHEAVLRFVFILYHSLKTRIVWQFCRNYTKYETKAYSNKAAYNKDFLF